MMWPMYRIYRSSMVAGILLIAASIIIACMPVRPVVEVHALAASEGNLDAVVDEIWTEYESSLIDGDGDRWIALWVEDGVQMPPGEPLIEGKDAIKVSNDAFLKLFDVTEFEITGWVTRAP